MNSSAKGMIGAAAIAALAGCVEVSAPGGGSSNSVVAPPGMIDECIRQVRVGQPNAVITTRDPILAGPDNRVFVGMTVNGVNWGCRIENNGSYTAFPNFAN
jgi:hypothetical protein